MNRYLAAKIKERLAQGRGDFELNPKEVEFLQFCCQDMPYHVIARRMGKSPRTIDGYRDTLFMLLEVRSRTGLVLWCLKTGFLEVDEIILTPNRKTKRKKPS